jgi:hypothetical protein
MLIQIPQKVPKHIPEKADYSPKKSAVYQQPNLFIQWINIFRFTPQASGENIRLY